MWHDISGPNVRDGADNLGDKVMSGPRTRPWKRRIALPDASLRSLSAAISTLLIRPRELNELISYSHQKTSPTHGRRLYRKGETGSSQLSINYRPFGTATAAHDLFEIILLGGSELAE